MRFVPLLFSLLSLVLSLSPSAVHSAIPGDLITSLPGWGATPTPQYSGMTDLYGNGEKFSHYWFVESSNAPATDPVVLWLNGGPGCSSLDGYWYENGPLHFSGATDPSGLPVVVENPNTWASIANMLYLESPIGVGFSYSTNPNDYNTNDTQTAIDSYHFLVQWFKGFPEYANNPFFIAGESYAGIYVPTLAQQIVQNNAQPGAPQILLKGTMAGNGCEGTTVGSCGGSGTSILLDAMYGHDLFSLSSYNQLASVCPDPNNPDSACNSLLTQISYEVGNVDIYDIYDTACISGPMAADSNVRKSNVTATKPAPLRAPVPFLRQLQSLRNKNAASPFSSTPVPGPVECIDAILASAYLNNAAVQQAIHVPSPTVGPNGQWEICTSNINYNSNVASVGPIYQNDLIPNIRVMIYSGDADLCVPTRGSEAFATSLGYTQKQAWTSWTIDNQVQGYIVDYDVPTQFSFVTIKGAGHMVPQYKPISSLRMFSSFINDESLYNLNKKVEL